MFRDCDDSRNIAGRPDRLPDGHDAAKTHSPAEQPLQSRHDLTATTARQGCSLPGDGPAHLLKTKSAISLLTLTQDNFSRPQPPIPKR
jgi:hypothetical protein